MELAHLLGGQTAAAGDHRHLGIVHAREHVEVVLAEMLAHRRVHVGLDGAFEIARPDDRGLEAEEIHRIAVEIRLHRLRRHVDAAEIGHRHVIAAGRHREVGRFGALDPRPHLLPRLPECSEAAEELVELGEVHRQIGVGEIDDNRMDLGVLRGFFEELTELVEVLPLPRATADDQARWIELVGTDTVFVGPAERDQLHLELRRLGFRFRLGFLPLLGPRGLGIGWLFGGLGFDGLLFGRLGVHRLCCGGGRFGRGRRFGGRLRLGGRRGLGHGRGAVVGLGQAGSRCQGEQEGRAPHQFQNQSTGQCAASSLHAFLPAMVDCLGGRRAPRNPFPTRRIRSGRGGDQSH